MCIPQLSTSRSNQQQHWNSIRKTVFSNNDLRQSISQLSLRFPQIRIRGLHFDSWTWLAKYQRAGPSWNLSILLFDSQTWLEKYRRAGPFCDLSMKVQMNIGRFNVHNLISEDIIDDNGQSRINFVSNLSCLYILTLLSLFRRWFIIKSETCSSLITKQIDLAMLTHLHAATKYFWF